MAGNRVLAIARVHKQLHLTGSLEEIEIDAFLRRLYESLKQTAPAQRRDQYYQRMALGSFRRRSRIAGGLDIDQSKGFGMQVVKAFVRRLNAKMAVSSRPGRTSFEIISIQT
jgi:two-component sensor histidine kinase